MVDGNIIDKTFLALSREPGTPKVFKLAKKYTEHRFY